MRRAQEEQTRSNSPAIAVAPKGNSGHRMPVKILPFILTATILAGTAMAEPAPGTNALEVLTADESNALIQYHIDRIERADGVALTENEKAFLTKYREDEAAKEAAKVKRIQEQRATPLWDRIKNMKPILILFGGAIGFFWLLALIFSFCERLKEKWEDWRYDAYFRKKDREDDTTAN